MLRLDVTDLACRRGERLVVSGVTFGLGGGEALVITGRNGAGKSTLLAALSGLLRPDRGSVSFSGTGDRPGRESCHYLAHRDGLKGALTCRENLAFAARLLGDPMRPPAEALASVGLSAAAELPAGILSAGQRRRLALARLLVARRPLWLLDEPGTALDAEGQEMLAGLMRGHREGGGAIVAATHAPLGLPDARMLELTRVAA